MSFDQNKIQEAITNHRYEWRKHVLQRLVERKNLN
jgi:hypothetical protein